MADVRKGGGERIAKPQLRLHTRHHHLSSTTDSARRSLGLGVACSSSPLSDISLRELSPFHEALLLHNGVLEVSLLPEARKLLLELHLIGKNSLF